MRKIRSAHHASYGLALFVISLITLLILAALAIKVFLIFKQSSFDGKHQYSIELQEPGQTRFFVLNPDDISLHTVLIAGKISGSPELALGIPVDATLQDKADITSFSSLANALLFKRGELHASTTIVDGINAFIFVHTSDTNKTLSAQTSIQADPNTQDVILSKVFVDSAIYKAGESVAIVNGTNVAGLGNRIARLFTHIGVNVVSVTTADTSTPMSSVAYVGNLSYTVVRLSHLLHLPAVRLSTAAISDITVTLGTDKSQQFQ